MSIPLASLFGFLLVLTRVAGAFVFLPLPGLKAGPDAARVVFVLALTISLYQWWPHVDGLETSLARLAFFLISEAAFGLAIGLAPMILMDTLQMAAQVASLQAGYSYASTIDPSTNADSSVLLVFAQTLSGLLFFALGLDRKLFRALAPSLNAFPPGATWFNGHVAGNWGSAALAGEAIRMCGSIFGAGLRLALPVVALMLFADLTLALVGRLQSQLRLITLAFPVKMLIALAALGWLMVSYSHAFSEASSKLSMPWGVLGIIR